MGEQADVVVVGSGAGALVAANAAATAGASVLVLERTGQLGGGSALSTGLLFVPNHPWMADVETADSTAEALAYLEHLNGGLVEPARLETFLHRAAEMIGWVTDETPLEIRPVQDLPDFHPDLPGGKSGGRHLAAVPSSGELLGDWAARTRRSQSLPLAYYEIEEMGGPARVRDWDFTLIAERMTRDIRAQGAGIVAPLVAGALGRGVELRVNERVTGLLFDGDGVHGVRVERDGDVVDIHARSGVVLATGGFEWNREMNRRFLRGPLEGPLTVPANEGDGQILGSLAGGALALMHDAVWAPVLSIPGEEYEGRPYWRNLASEKGRPHSLMVNRQGRRFVNENVNYFDMGRSLHAFDAATYTYPNLPAFLVFDSAYKSTYPVATAMPGEATPSWIWEAPTLEGLADLAGIDAAGLRATVDQFNGFAGSGDDPDFGRGRTTFDRYYGDRSIGPNPTLGTVDSPPFFAIRVDVGSFGNRGGLVGNDDGQVLDSAGRPIPGLFACGNALAQLIFGRGYEGGATLAQAMTFGYAAARAATRTGD